MRTRCPSARWFRIDTRRHTAASVVDALALCQEFQPCTSSGQSAVVLLAPLAPLCHALPRFATLCHALPRSNAAMPEADDGRAFLAIFLLSTRETTSLRSRKESVPKTSRRLSTSNTQQRLPSAEKSTSQRQMHLVVSAHVSASEEPAGGSKRLVTFLLRPNELSSHHAGVHHDDG